MEVIIYSSPDDKKKNRGFCFLEYESHKAASLAKRRLGTGRIKVWGCDIIVDWADPQEEPDEQTMSKVKVLYVRNLTQDISEEKLKESFEAFGKVERVKKIKDYAFIHFEDRDNAVKVSFELFFLNYAQLNDCNIIIGNGRIRWQRNGWIEYRSLLSQTSVRQKEERRDSTCKGEANDANDASSRRVSVKLTNSTLSFSLKIYY